MAVTYTYLAPSTGETKIEVTFESDIPALTHVRSVNAVFDNDAYDADATEIRVSEVANGVANKIAIGAITPPAEEESEGE